MIGEFLELRRMMNNRRLPPAELESLKNQKLQALVHYAYEQVPYYRTLFQSAGLLPEHIRTVKDLRHIPISTKDDLRSAGVARITSQEVDSAACRVVQTSGTTGKPFRISLTPRDLRARRLVEFRALLSIGFRPRDRLTVLGPLQPHVRRWHQQLGLYRSVNISPTLPIDEQIDLLKRSRPTILWVYPTVLKSILAHVNYRLETIIFPRILISSAEVCDDMVKRSIQETSKIEMFNFYGSNEVGRIASECPAHVGLHINEDHVILECVDTGNPAAAETSGETVVTSLTAWGQPFIRYRLGDMCTPIEKPCSCGSSFSLIDSPRGRSDDVITLPSGRIVSMWPFTFLLRTLERLEQYRIIQEQTDYLVIQLVFRGEPDHEDLVALRSRCLDRLGEPVRIDIQCVDAIKDDAPKFKTFVSKVSVGELSPFSEV